MRQFAAFADPVRREIVELLADGPATAGAIAARFPVSRPAVSRHLRVLREAGLVRSQVRARSRVYTLDRAALAEPAAWLDRLRVPAGLPGPAGRLDALDTELRRARRAAQDDARSASSARPRGDAHDTG